VVAEAAGLRKHLKAVFEANQKALALQSAKTVSVDLHALGADAHLEMMLMLKRRLDAATADWEARSRELALRTTLE